MTEKDKIINQIVRFKNRNIYEQERKLLAEKRRIENWLFQAELSKLSKEELMKKFNYEKPIYL